MTETRPAARPWDRRFIVARARFAAALVVVVALQAVAHSAATALSDADRAWMEDVLEAWRVTSREDLGLAREPLPWLVFYDEQRVWHVSADASFFEGARPVDASARFDGRPVSVRGLEHSGTVRLPDGNEIPARLAS